MQEEIRKRCRIRRVPVHLHVHYILVLRSYLYVISGLRLAVVHCVLLHAHECGIGIRLGIAVAGTECLEMLLVLLQFLLMLLQFPDHLRLCPGCLLLVLCLTGLLSVLLIQFLYLSGKKLAVNDIGHGVGILSVVLCYAFIYLREDVPDLPFKLCLVLLYGLLPDKGVFIGYALYLRAVDVLLLKGYLTHVDKKSHDLGEQLVHSILHVLTAEAVDGAERGSLAAAEPHVVDVVLQGILYLAAGIDVVHVGIENHLQQHAGVIRRTAEGLVSFQQSRDV